MELEGLAVVAPHGPAHAGPLRLGQAGAPGAELGLQALHDRRIAAGEGTYTFGIRPEDVKVESGAPVEARVHDIENHGIEKVLTLRVGETLVRASVPARVTVAVEDTVHLGWNAEKVIFFDPATGVNLAHKAA